MNDSRNMMRNGRRRARRGVSLIEVLVVLVLLVLGILIIVRLYPSGFFSINSIGDAALADSLGQAAVQSQAQNVANLPDSILPGTLTTLTHADGDYDPDFNPTVQPDYSVTLDSARVVNNETVTIPAASGTARQSLYVVNYGPIVLGTAAAPIHPSGSLSQLYQYLTVNSTPWTAIAGDETAAVSATPTYAQDTLSPHQEQFLVDLTNKMIAVPYAAYTSTGPSTATSYPQKIVAVIVASDGNSYTQYLNMPPGTPRDTTNPNAPHDGTGTLYLPDTASNYQGGWFDPTTQYGDASASTPHTLPPVTTTWQRVILYRPYQPVVSTNAFDNDPYEFKLAADNFGAPAPSTNANPGAILFNPKAAGGSGSAALKAQISYQTYSWSILHEDRDIPALPLNNTAVIRLTLKNLKRAGDPNADNTIYTGLGDVHPGTVGGNQSVVIMDLDTGIVVASTDPTLINDEDLNGTVVDPTGQTVNVSYSTGRITFGYNPFGLPPSGDNQNGATPRAHRVRIFYAGDADWTVAVQKAPSYYNFNSAALATSANGLLPGQYTFDPSLKLVYFPRCDAGKTVEVDGTYVQGGALHSFAYTNAISPVLTTLVSGSYPTVDIGAQTPPLSNTATNITISAVRGLSARSVVVWKERDRWRVHSVDAFLNRPQ